jgi:hypothetical protein
MSSYWVLIFVVFVMPLLLGVGLLVASSRMRRRGTRVAALIGGVFCLLVFAFYAVLTGPYVWALHLESKWRPADPQTRLEMESFLSLYSQREIDIDTSPWARGSEFNPGDRMIRYSVLLGAPLDVVYTRDDLVVGIFTTYE